MNQYAQLLPTFFKPLANLRSFGQVETVVETISSSKRHYEVISQGPFVIFNHIHKGKSNRQFILFTPNFSPMPGKPSGGKQLSVLLQPLSSSGQTLNLIFDNEGNSKAFYEYWLESFQKYCEFINDPNFIETLPPIQASETLDALFPGKPHISKIVGVIANVVGKMTFQAHIVDDPHKVVCGSTVPLNSNATIITTLTPIKSLGGVDALCQSFTIIETQKNSKTISHYKCKDINEMSKWVLYIHSYSNTSNKKKAPSRTPPQNPPARSSISKATSAAAIPPAAVATKQEPQEKPARQTRTQSKQTQAPKPVETSKPVTPRTTSINEPVKPAKPESYERPSTIPPPSQPEKESNLAMKSHQKSLPQIVISTIEEPEPEEPSKIAEPEVKVEVEKPVEVEKKDDNKKERAKVSFENLQAVAAATGATEKAKSRKKRSTSVSGIQYIEEFTHYKIQEFDYKPQLDLIRKRLESRPSHDIFTPPSYEKLSQDNQITKITLEEQTDIQKLIDDALESLVGEDVHAIEPNIYYPEESNQEIVDKTISAHSDIKVDFASYFNFSLFPHFSTDYLQNPGSYTCDFLTQFIVMDNQLRTSTASSHELSDPDGKRLCFLVCALLLNGYKEYPYGSFLNALREMQLAVSELAPICIKIESRKKLTILEEGTLIASDLLTMNLLGTFLREIKRNDEWVNRFYNKTAFLMNDDLLDNIIITLQPILNTHSFEVDPRMNETEISKSFTKEDKKRFIDTPGFAYLDIDQIFEPNADPVRIIAKQIEYGIMPGRFLGTNTWDIITEISKERHENVEWEKFEDYIKFNSGKLLQGTSHLENLIRESIAIKKVHIWFLYIAAERSILSKYYYPDSSLLDYYRVKYIASKLYLFNQTKLSK